MEGSEVAEETPSEDSIIASVQMVTLARQMDTAGAAATVATMQAIEKTYGSDTLVAKLLRLDALYSGVLIAVEPAGTA